MQKIDGIIKRTKKNVKIGKEKIIYKASFNIHNYGITLNIQTKNDGEIRFVINHSELLELIKEKHIRTEQARIENSNSILEHIQGLI